MAKTYAVFLSVLCVISVLTSCYGGYVITTPRQWSTGETARVCLFTMGTPPVGVINVSLTSPKSLEEEREIIIPETTLNFPAGQKASCSELNVPNTKRYEGRLEVRGQVGGSIVNHTGVISLGHINPITFIQTDKAFYLPGQTVHFRLLTITGPYMQVSTQKYMMVWVTTPSNTRVAQWSDLDNAGGLVHLSLQLADEPEQGTYTIHAESAKDKHVKSFDVKDYVLPRFEVKVTANKYVLATDRHFNFTVCARYTFGQPVKGSVRLEVNNAQRRKCFVSIVRNATISECREFVVSTSEMQVIDCQVYSLHAVARVTEEGTGVELTGEATLPVSRTQVSLMPVYEDKYMKPYLPFTLQVRAELPDKSPASGVAVEVCAAGKCTVMVSPPDGVLTVVLPSYSTKRLFMKTLDCRAGMNEGSFYMEMKHYYSPSNSSLLIYAPDNHMGCAPGRPQQHMLTLFYAADQSTATITVQVVSRGQIQYWKTQEYDLLEKELPVKVEGLVEPLPHHPNTTVTGFVNLLVELPLAASPNVMVVVWYARRDGEVVSDARELRVEKCLGNPVTLDWVATEAQPGDGTMFTLSSEPNSLCSLGVVDKSTQLLSMAAEPLLDTLFNYVEGFSFSTWVNSQTKDYEYCQKHFDERSNILTPTDKNLPSLPVSPAPIYNYYSDYVDALSMFDDAGLYIFTNLTVETRPCEKEAWQPIGFLPATVFADIHPGSQARSSQSQERVEGTTLARTKFPETWLWSLIMQQSSGVTKQEVKVPDTITEWVGKAVCVHQQKGVGLSPTASITTFTPFFLDLTLPPSVKRGEILPVKISVFNYMGRNLPIRVTLQESSEYKIVDEPGTSGAVGRRTSCVAAQEKVVHTVKLDLLALGDVNITVAAFVDYLSALQCGPGLDISRSDALIKPIKVEAEGFPKEKTWSKYVCSKEINETIKSLEHWEISGPAVTVMGSERAWVSVVGDLLGSTLENLGSLIRMPYGCGEQNMINFAPNVFILQYLEATRQTMPEVHKKLITLMNTGYQRQLLYRRSDGSFSAFGNADPSGSTWLTAFVLKSFARARQYILVDGSVLNETNSWLKMKQNNSGCFFSVGMVNKAMKGGLNGNDSSVPLTAYVIISLLEAGNDPMSPEVLRAVKCLLNGKQTVDPYILALETYALSLARHKEAPRVLQMLMDQAVVQPNEIYWKLQDSPGSSMGVAVETASYAVLAMMTLNADGPNLMASKIVKWITAQRNGQGGFHSTQDTVVALQALAVYETLQHQGPPDVKTTVNATGFIHTFRINDSNKLLQQLVNLPTPPINVSIGIEGQGCVVLQAVLRYNIPIPESGQAFSLTVETETEPDVACVTKRITACASYLLADGSSNMAVIEVKLVSGYVAEKADLEHLKANKTVKRYEETGSSISFYVAELTSAQTCVNFSVVREVDVEKAKPGTASVLDYYKPEFSVEKSYKLPPGAECRALDA